MTLLMSMMTHNVGPRKLNAFNNVRGVKSLTGRVREAHLIPGVYQRKPTPTRVFLILVYAADPSFFAQAFEQTN